MHTAGARTLREDDNEMSREAVLLEWEQKIEAAERRENDRSQAEFGLGAEPDRPRRTGRFARAPQESDSSTRGRPALQLVEVDPAPAQSRFERAVDPPDPGTERRTITITGQPGPARRRRSVVEAQIAEPDRIALWAFLLGLFLVAVAAGTAHA